MSRSSSSNGRRRDDLAEYWYEKVSWETKTIEEMREHTIPEKISPVEKTILMLNSQSTIQRLAGIRSIPSLMISERIETNRRILNKFQILIEQNVDSEEQNVAAEALFTMVENRSLSFDDFMKNFLQIILNWVFPTTNHRYSTDFGAIWCQSLCNIIEILPETSSFTTLLDLIFNQNRHGSYVRERFMLVLAKISTRLPSDCVINRIVPVFKSFVNDTNSDIRALSCKRLLFVSENLGSSEIFSLILPLFVILSKDENLSVRENCFDCLLSVALRLKRSKSIDQIVEMLVALIKFGLASRNGKFLATISQRLGDLCKMFEEFPIDEQRFVREIFLHLSAEKNQIECRSNCVVNFSKIVEYLKFDRFHEEFKDVFLQFCRDNELKIRCLTCSILVELGKSIDRFFRNATDDEQIFERKKFLDVVWNGFSILLVDSNTEVLLVLVKFQSEIFKIFARDPSEGLLSGAISNSPSIDDADNFLVRLLEFERRIFETTLSWRSCIFSLQSFVLLPFLLTSEQIQSKILPKVYSRIFSKQVCVREVAVDCYVQLLRKIPRRSIRKSAIQKLKSELLFHKSYQWRVMYIRACRQILIYYSKRFFKENFLDTILSIDYENVSSVRIELIPLLIEIKSILRLPTDQQAISKIGAIMEYFLGCKTLTLHDFANQGLLKLDQIRSYNPTLSEDDEDQRKESEEIFLDELDPSARRPASKSTDQQHSLSRRMILETSICTRNSSLKSPRPSKSFSDDPSRKSSLALETTNDVKISSSKQRKKQTINEGTTSRLAQQTSSKKSSKQKLTSQ